MWDPIDSACFWLENLHVGAKDAQSLIQGGLLVVLRDQKPVVSFGRVKLSHRHPWGCWESLKKKARFFPAEWKENTNKIAETAG